MLLFQGPTTLRTTLGHRFGAAGNSRKDVVKPYHKLMQERVWLLTVERDLKEGSWRDQAVFISPRFSAQPREHDCRQPPLTIYLLKLYSCDSYLP